jgi:hypothetical protein
MHNRQSLVTLGAKHAARVGVTRFIRDFIGTKSLGRKIISTVLITIAFHFISKGRHYTTVDTEVMADDIIDAEII